jgi:hypothetical protein
MKKAKRYSLDHQRRCFLKNSAATGTGLAVAAALPGLASATEESDSPSESKSQKGYRLTPHIAAYYETMTS